MCVYRVLATGLVTSVVSPTFANMIVNGEFDLAVPLNASGNGWTSQNVFGGNQGGWYASGGNSGGYFWLNNRGQSSSDPTIFQMVSLDVGGVYRLTFDFRSISITDRPADATGSFAIDIGGVTLFEAGPSADWESGSIEFQAEQADTVIRFRAEVSGSDNDFGIDNVSLNLVPTPGAAAVLALSGVLTTRRRRGSRHT